MLQFLNKSQWKNNKYYDELEDRKLQKSELKLHYRAEIYFCHEIWRTSMCRKSETSIYLLDISIRNTQEKSIKFLSNDSKIHNDIKLWSNTSSSNRWR